MRKLSTLEKRNERTGYLFILPWIIGFLIFFLSPIVNSLLYAFQNVSVRAGGLDRPFVGVQFFKQALLEDDAFLPKLSAAFGDLVYQVPIILVFSLFVAVILNQKFKGRGAVGDQGGRRGAHHIGHHLGIHGVLGGHIQRPVSNRGAGGAAVLHDLGHRPDFRHDVDVGHPDSPVPVGASVHPGQPV